MSQAFSEVDDDNLDLSSYAVTIQKRQSEELMIYTIKSNTIASLKVGSLFLGPTESEPTRSSSFRQDGNPPHG